MAQTRNGFIPSSETDERRCRFEFVRGNVPEVGVLPKLDGCRNCAKGRTTVGCGKGGILGLAKADDRFELEFSEYETGLLERPSMESPAER